MDTQSMMEKAEHLISGIVDLPTIPEITTRVAALLDRPDVELDEVADLILTDQVMTARVIKIVKSPLFKSTHEITTLKRALIYLGFRRIKEIALTCSVMQAFEGGKGAFDIKTFWQHSFGVGIVSRIIAEQVRYPETEKAYICGIIHDIGEVFLSNCLRDDFEKIIEMIQGTSRCFIDAEIELLGTSHCEIGYCLARKWNFPPDYCDVIAHHHASYNATVDPVLVSIVNLADLFCSVRHMDYGGREWVNFNLADEEAWKLLQSLSPDFSKFDVERFCFELDERVPEVFDLVDALFQGGSR